MQAAANSLDFIIDTASGDHAFDPYLALLKTMGVFVLVGFPSEIKFHPGSLNMGMHIFLPQNFAYVVFYVTFV